jgi:hypothetical protein
MDNGHDPNYLWDLVEDDTVVFYKPFRNFTIGVQYT